MSAFLGPIHYWLYNKIRYVINREQMLYERAEAQCGTLAEELREQVWQSYGCPLPDKDLAELIDKDNIHGWLQRQINIAETREAAFISALMNACDETDYKLIANVFQEHGVNCGKTAIELGKYDESRADAIYKAINDFYLNGMPCDQADRVVEISAEKVVWEEQSCLQEPNWKRAEADIKMMKDFYKNWLLGFIKTMNPGFSYHQTADSATVFHTIEKIK